MSTVKPLFVRFGPERKTFINVGLDLTMFAEKGDVPFWVRQQRKIAHQIKRRNENTVFELVMLEAPLEITRHVKGLIPWDEGICVNCKKKEWFEDNRIPVPEEIRNGC